ncbi:MAG: hypothetical protein ACLFOY_10520 [Desulfatibacillaceae bacterium]
MKAFVMVALLTVTASLGYYGFDDAVRDIAAGKQGVHAARDVVDTVDKVFTESRTDEATREFFEFFSDSFADFNFKKLYDSEYFQPPDEAWRAVSFQGRNAADGYHFSLCNLGTTLDPAYGLGSFLSEFSLKENKHSGYGSASFSGKMGITGDASVYTHKNFLAWPEGHLRVVDPDNLARALSLSGGSVHTIAENSGKLNNLFAQAFPSFMEFVTRYVDPLPEAQVFSGENGYTRLNIRLVVRVEEMKRDFPELADYLRDLFGTGNVDIVASNISGHTLFRLRVDAQPEFLNFTCRTRDGKLVPWAADGQPVFREEIRLTELSSYATKNNVDVLFKAKGLTFDTRGVEVVSRYDDTRGNGDFEVRLSRVPRAEVSGLVYHFLPKWLVNLFIPKDMEELMHDFFRLMVSANSGDGSYMRLAWDTSDPEEIRLKVNGSTELMDSFFVRFGVATLWNKFRLDDDQREEFIEINAMALEAIRSDLDRMAGST